MDNQIIVTASTAITAVIEIFKIIKDENTWYRHRKIKQRIDDEIFEQQYLKSIEENINKINSDNFKEPNPSIIFPAIKESFIYINEESLRELFAKLIAASYDKTKTGNLHPGFIEVIKQLSPNDCRVLVFLHDNQSNFEIITAIQGDNEYPILNSDLTKHIGIEQIALSLNNLKRLGIIDITSYQLTKNMVFISTTDDYDDDQEENSLKINSSLESLLPSDKYHVIKSAAYLTQFGNSFLKVCID